MTLRLREHTTTAGAAARAQAPAPVRAEAALDTAIERARDALCAAQHAEGHWCYELEADCTIPAEYILMMHFMDEIEHELEPKLAAHLREHQNIEGGWPLYTGGYMDLSCTVKAYYALKLAGDDPQAPHMRAAREAVLARGGAARANVFTRIVLAQFGQVPWRAVPFIPAEIMLLPKWSPFHLSKVSYWSRTVMVPLFVLCSLKARAVNPRGTDIRELFVTPPEEEREYFPSWSALNTAFIYLDAIGRHLEPLIPGLVRKRALKAAERWFIERLNGEDGLGAIFPAMVNAHEALAHLGYPADHPYRRQTKAALRKLVVERGPDTAYCQPCVSPVWDTTLAALALQEAGGPGTDDVVRRALDWLVECQVREPIGDWRDDHPDLPAGGWAFQFANPHYPDLDDTAAVVWAMQRAEDRERYGEAIDRATDWLVGMQCSNGGFAAFDSNNTYYYLNEIPFADHGALLDPPTSDVSARCLVALGRRGRDADNAAARRCIGFLDAEQESSGAWFGRWGTNYIYGTWSVVTALLEAGESPSHPRIRRAAAWLKSVQRHDGGWGETNDSYDSEVLAGRGAVSTAFQTAWALLALMAAGEVDSDAVARGVDYLLRRQAEDGLWHDPGYTAPGFPRVFYLKYHGYDKYFPLWALARYRNLRARD